MFFEKIIDLFVKTLLSIHHINKREKRYDLSDYIIYVVVVDVDNKVDRILYGGL